MKKAVFLILGFLSFPTIAGEWVTLEPQNLAQYEVTQQGALSFANEGLYIKHKAVFTTTSSCAKKEFLAITDTKLADRALSSLMFAIASNKTMRFYVEGCNNDYIQAKMFMLIP
jgi:hypothetical protein